MQLGPLTQYLSYHLYNAMQLAPKISEESDIELLHEFRVSIRRCRSLLKLYLPDAYALTALLQIIVKQTNPLREIDVLLESLNPKTYPHLVHKLQKHRKAEYRRIYTEPFIQETLATLQTVYDSIIDLNPNISPDKLVTEAESFFKESLIQYDLTDRKTSSKALHTIRIRFKISRYALEFLAQASLHNEHAKIKTCKQHQNHLGAVQDVVDQIELIKTLCSQAKSDEYHHLLKERQKRLKKLKNITNSSQ